MKSPFGLLALWILLCSTSVVLAASISPSLTEHEKGSIKRSFFESYSSPAQSLLGRGETSDTHVERSNTIRHFLDLILHARREDARLMHNRATALTKAQKARLATLQSKLASLEAKRKAYVATMTTLDSKICNASSQSKANSYIKQYDAVEANHAAVLVSIAKVRKLIAAITG